MVVSTMGITIYAGGNEYHVNSAAFNGYVDTPEGKERKVLQVAGDNTSPLNDDGKNAPVSKNPAPPAAPFPAKMAPTSSQPPSADPVPSAPATPPMPTSDGPTSEPQIGPGTEDDRGSEYVGGSQVDPKPLPNPEGGALAPNPDNATYTPVGGEDADSFDSDSAKPDLSTLPYFMGTLHLDTDARTGLAKWPLDFSVIEKDTKRPNKPYNRAQDPQHVDNEDAEKVGEVEKPYQTGLPI